MILLISKVQEADKFIIYLFQMYQKSGRLQVIFYSRILFF